MDKPSNIRYKNNLNIPFFCFTCSLPYRLFDDNVHFTRTDKINIDNIVYGKEKYLKSSGFKICRINSGNGGLLYHYDSIVDVIEEYDPDVLAISETWIDVDTNCDLLHIN